MRKEHSTTLVTSGSRHALDLDISTILIVERLVGELLGWDEVDWSTVQPHKGRKFSFGRQRQNEPSIYDQLMPLFDRCDPAVGDFSTLKPSPVVNANLSKLVGYLCVHIGTHSLPADETNDPVLQRTAEQETLHLAVIDRLLGRIEGHRDLNERADRLKRIAAAAENELEHHFADLINQRLEQSFLPGGKVDQYKYYSLHDQAKGRVEVTRLLNEQELAHLSVPKLSLDDEALIRIEMAKILLNRFPYVRNYELMLLAELAMLQHRLPPRFVPERRLSSRTGKIDTALIEGFDQVIDRVSPRLEQLGQAAWQGSLTERTIAICGSGPLPLSALFLHLFTGAAIILIDEDQGAVKRSARLIANLEQLGILEPDALTVMQQNAGDVLFRATDRPSNQTAGALVACDAVMIASLVDAEAKARIAKQFGGDPNAPELLVMRSATGLAAKLAYDPVPTEAFSQGRLAYCGETLPATQINTHMGRVEAIERGVVCAKSPDVLAVAHNDVVNTTEVYRKIPFEIGTCTTIEDWIQQLETVDARLGVR